MLAAAGKPYSWNYTAADQDAGLNVAASIFDITSGSPVFVDQVPMEHVLVGSYAGFFTPESGKIYNIISLVYTDVGLTIVDVTRAPAAETIATIFKHAKEDLF